MRQRAQSLFLDKYLIVGLLLLSVQCLIFSTIDFPIYGSLCLHHIPEVFGFLFIGFWLADHSPLWVAPLVYAVSPFLSQLLVKHSFTLGGILASAMVSLPLLIGDWTERYRSKRKQP